MSTGVHTHTHTSAHTPHAHAQDEPLLQKEMQSLSKDAGMGSLIPVMDRRFRFLFLVSGILFFFGCHNYLQELIMRLPGFEVGVFLGYLEVLGVAVCAFFERQWLGETTRRAPWSSYVMLSFCLLVSSATSNIALKYINYPTKVRVSCVCRVCVCVCVCVC